MWFVEMTDSDPSQEPLQGLPAGMPRGYAQYKPLQGSAPSPTPLKNVGGYEELVAFFDSRGDGLRRSKQGLTSIDHHIDEPADRTTLARLSRAMGMFYGDLLTHSVPGAHWEVTAGVDRCVRITPNTAVSVVPVAERRLTVGSPTLLRNYEHVMKVVTHEV
ncbi:MAG: hypothetical protein JWP57_4470 [Spirosoma sp.]|nr:hypothetical protein [Spirosoma sp.]